MLQVLRVDYSARFFGFGISIGVGWF